MPNWCANILKLQHTDPQMILRAKTAFENGSLLNEFVPCPPELVHTVSGAVGPPDSPKQNEHERQRALNFAKWGHTDWYGWRVANWGTKWDIGGADCSVEVTEQGLTLSFDSAWSPPVEAYSTLVDQGFDVQAYYWEPGMCFCGSWINGQDVYVEYPGESDEAEKVIPQEIDQLFNIVGNMADWESQEASFTDP